MIKSAVVGVGFIGEEHIEAIRRTNLGWVEAIVGRDLEKTKAKAEVFQIIMTFSRSWKIRKFRSFIYVRRMRFIIRW